MKVSSHVIASLSTGAAVWLFANSLHAGLVCFVSGVLIDIDHIIEYMINFGWKGLTLKKVYQASKQMGKQEGDYRFKRLYLVFHMIEIAVLLWAVSICTKNIYLLAIALGYSTHLILDCIGNSRIYPCSYFIVGRAIRRFNSNRLFRKTLF